MVEVEIQIFKHILRVVLIGVLFLLISLILRQPHKIFYEAPDAAIYGLGNAPRPVRAEILKQLDTFQEGYTHRDLDQVDTFMEQLFSARNLLVLSTMPDEIYIGREDASDLVYADWNAWGDCTFLMDTAHISSAGDVAWISAIGYVQFDMPRFLILPLRLSVVMVKEDLAWKFQTMQFQFDLTLIPLFLIAALLTARFFVSLVGLGVSIVKRVRKKKQRQPK